MVKRHRTGNILHQSTSILVFLILLGSFFSSKSWAAPTGGSVSSGTATINQSGNNTTINQSSQATIINWQGFNTAANESVQFAQPGTSSIALNRVIGGGITQYNGSLAANGHVWLLNPNGVVFGQSAQVNVYGILASTLAIQDSDFLNSNYHFTQTAGMPLAAVVNHGSITGKVALLAPLVYNTGSIVTNNGRVVLGGTTDATVSFDANGLIEFVSNSLGTAPGTVVMNQADVDSTLTGVVNNKSIFPAGSVTFSNGVASLGGVGGSVVNAGKLTATGSAAKGSQNLTIQADIAAVLASGSQLSATASNGNPGGNIYVFGGNDIALLQATVDSNADGGNIDFASNGGFTANNSTVSMENAGNGGTLEALSATGMTITQSTFEIVNSNPTQNDLRLSTDGVFNGTQFTEYGKNIEDLIAFGNNGLNASGSTFNLDTGQNEKILAENDMNLKNTTVSANNNGDQIVSTEGNLTIDQSTFTHTQGGNTNFYAVKNLNMTASTVTNNQTNNFQLEGDGPSVSVTQTQITNNITGNSSLVSGGTMTLSQVTLQNTSDGNLTIFAPTELDVTGSNISQSTGGVLELQTNGNMNVSTSNISGNASGDVDLLAAGNLNLTTSQVSISNSPSSNVRVSANGVLTVTNSTVSGSNNQDVILFGDSGVVMNGSQVTQTTGRNLEILSEKDLDISNSTVSVPFNSGQLLISADGNVNINSTTVSHTTSTGSTTVNGGGSVNISASTFQDTQTPTILYQAGTTLTISNTTISDNLFAGDVTLSSGGDMSLSGMSLLVGSAGNLALTSGHDLNIVNGSTVEHVGGPLNTVVPTANTTMTAVNDLNVNLSQLLNGSDNNVSLSAGHNLTFGNSLLNDVSLNDTSLSAGNDVALNYSNLSVGDPAHDFSINAVNDLQATGSSILLVNGHDLTLASMGTLELTGSNVSGSNINDYTISAPGNVTISGGSTVAQYGNNETITSGQKLEIDGSNVYYNAGPNTPSGNFLLNANGQLNIENGTQVLDGGGAKATLQSGGDTDIQFSYLDFTNNNLYFTSGGKMNFANDFVGHGAGQVTTIVCAASPGLGFNNTNVNVSGGQLNITSNAAVNLTASTISYEDGSAMNVTAGTIGVGQGSILSGHNISGTSTLSGSTAVALSGGSSIAFATSGLVYVQSLGINGFVGVTTGSNITNSNGGSLVVQAYGPIAVDASSAISSPGGGTTTIQQNLH